jgi:hypothetical protein
MAVGTGRGIQSWRASRQAEARRKHPMNPHPLASADPQIAGAVLLGSFYRTAGAEALFRAFLAECDNDRLAVRFWIEAFQSIAEKDNSGKQR